MFRKIIFNIARTIAALIMLQTLYFKFTAHPESVYIFEKIGMEPLGRLGVGVAELMASILYFVPGLSGLGAVIGTGLMAGAIGMHLTILGIDVQGDEGYLFYLACAVLFCSLVVLWFKKNELLLLFNKLLKRR